MTPDELEANATPSSRDDRARERRTHTEVLPPPFQTEEGTVGADRRSHLDRRSAWIKSFVIGQADAQDD